MPTPTPTSLLSQRQKEVADLLALGFKNSEIADQLGISIKTIDTHRMMILKKLALRNNVDLARHALRQGWVQL